MACFITFEGIEGTGKTTQLNLLARWLRERFGQEPVITREPGGCPIADQIRSTLLDSANSRMDERTELLLYAAARAQHMAEIIEPALAAGRFVLCDRFTDATLAYQGFGRGLSAELIEELNQLATQGIEPDLTLLLDISPEQGIRRARARNAASSGPDEDRFERENLAFHRRVRDGYLALEKRHARVQRIDASGTIEHVAERIRTATMRFLEKKRAI